MNLILLFEEDFVAPSTVRLQGRRWEHIVRVHRARVGDPLRVGRLDGPIGTGVVARLTPDALEMAVSLDYAPPPPLPISLLLALPRPKSLKKTLQVATAMGVKRIVLFHTHRVEKSYWQSPVLAPDALLGQMLVALEQAGDTVLPQVVLRRRFKPFVDDELPDLVRGTRALVAHPAATQPCPRVTQSAITLAVGPEGGFIPYEIEMLEARGFEAVTLGERRLRVEHAVPVLLGRLF
jgi:RsmE family RNA methyltransferase